MVTRGSLSLGALWHGACSPALSLGVGCSAAGVCFVALNRVNNSTAQRLNCFCYQLIVNGYSSELEPRRSLAWTCSPALSLGAGCSAAGVCFVALNRVNDS